MAVIARDVVAADQLVYAWPFPIGPEPVEVTCGEEETVVMCPAWLVGDRLGPGRHQWRTPDPTRPTNAYFVLNGPVEVSFDMMTSFVIPTTQHPVRIRAQGSLLVRCYDPGLLVAQFVGLPFDRVNDGIVRSATTSVERLLGRVLARRVLAHGAAIAVTEPSMLPSIIDELTAYNPTAGAVTGLAFVRFNQLVIQADDGGHGMGGPYQGYGNGGYAPQPYSTGAYSDPAYAASFSGHQPYPTGAVVAHDSSPGQTVPPAAAHVPPPGPTPAPPTSATTSSSTSGVVSGEIGVVSGEIGGSKKSSGTVPPSSNDAASVLPAGARVLVPSADGLLHASTVRQHQQGYYEVEIGATGQTVWVPAGAVIPQ